MRINKKHVFLFVFLSTIFSCQTSTNADVSNKESLSNNYQLVVLGTVQDGGSPHISCDRGCCIDLWGHKQIERQVVALGLVDKASKKKYIFEASPDFPSQMKDLKKYANSNKESPDGIFISHAHIGHYTGLMYLGKEAMNADSINVYVMPRMADFLKNNGPWSQLVSNGNIKITTIDDHLSVDINNQLEIIPFLVPHRDEYSETVGYKIKGPKKSVMFIPDIDKWEQWDKSILEEIRMTDFVLIDGTFYDGDEIPNREMSEIPHPFIIESMSLFDDLSDVEKNKVFFIHLNHSNPALNPDSEQSKNIENKGFHVARKGDVFDL